MSVSPGRRQEQTAGRATRWLTQGLETLWDELARRPADATPRHDFDILIIGSGYGGAMAAAELSACVGPEGQALRIAVLERGREYLPGQFPSRFAELPGHVRFSTPASTSPKGRREGLFDLRLGPDMCVVLANGLGGGSLINAGVMEPAAPEVFAQTAWPQGLRDDPAQMAHWYEQARQRLGSHGADGTPNTIELLDGHEPRRQHWLASLRGETAEVQARPVPITMALGAAPVSAAGLPLTRCIGCGDCATGCNHGAKQSLDTNALLLAQRRGVRLITGASVMHLERPVEGSGWTVRVNHSDEIMRRREPEPLTLRARRVVLAAGSLGSTEILLRSRQAGLAVSDRLGHQFSGNGDVLATVMGVPAALGAVADERQAPASRGVGPTITGLLDSGQGFVVEDLAIPGPLREVWAEGMALARTLDQLARGDESDHPADPESADPLSITDQDLLHVLPVALMGLDAAAGELRLPPSAAGSEPGQLSVHWPEARLDPAVEARHRWLAERLSGSGATLLANPLWRLLPPELGFVLGDARGPMLTVHPLGGCPMADHASQGVVNEWGQVFSGRGAEVHEDLVVLDGAIVPAALGINPALTITALALRALAQLRMEWGLQAQDLTPPQLGERPRFRVVPTEQAEPGLPTLAEFRERLGGFVHLPGSPGEPLKYLELSFQYEPVALRDLLQAGPKRRLHCAPGGGRLRLFEARPDASASGGAVAVRAGAAPGEGRLWMHAEWDDADALWVAPLAQAELRLFERAPRNALTRRWHGLSAWFMNRGWRDAAHALLDALAERRAATPGARQGLLAQGLAQARHAWALASRAGELRLMRYEIEIGRPEAVPSWAEALIGRRLLGIKRISYTRRGNPWRQLSLMRLEPGSPFQPAGHAQAVELELDLFHLARERVPLLRLAQAQDAPSAIRDVGALLGYVGRLLLSTHVWTFRKPDAAPPRRIERLPGPVPGLPPPEITELAAGRWGEAGEARKAVDRRASPDDERPVMIRLTRYRGRPGSRPILMIHGYSASGTTFAHHSVQPGPAKLLHDAGHDVWLLDMRSSAGMPTARLPWTFEEVAFNDIPLAIDQVLRATGAAQLDVFAHCMGSVMLHMALLEPRKQGFEHFFPLRRALLAERRIGRLVISQVTPLLMFSPANTLRAHLMQYLRPYLPLQDYAFRPEGEPGLLDQLIDRLLASLPYPEHEFDIENPPPPSIRRTPWVATRHRMDMLYGRDFAIANVDQPVFDFIDDHFGPLNMDTVAQAIEFARANEITDWQGASVYLDDLSKSLALLEAFPVLSVHGQDNGLCLPDSAALTAEHYQHVAPGRYRVHVVAGHGHQDCLIGRHLATKVFPPILAFLAGELDD